MGKIEKALRYNLRLAVAISRKYARFLILGVVCGSILFYFLPLLRNSARFQIETRSIGIVGQYSISDLPYEVLSLTSQGLTTISPDGSVTSGIAKLWEGSEDSKVFKFFLDPDIKWQDGENINADQISYSFKGVERSVVSDQVLEFKLNDSYSPFPVSVSRPVFRFSKSSYPKFLVKLFPCWFQIPPVGTGKYGLGCSKRDRSGVTSIALIPLDKALPKLVYKFYPTEEVAITAFKLGEVKELRDLSSPQMLTEWPDVSIHGEERADRFVGLFFNAGKDPFSDKNVRQALAYAINKNLFPNRAVSPISPSSWAYNNQVKLYEKDTARSLELFKKTGVKVSEINIEISTFPWLLRQAEVIKREWKEAGIESSVKVVSLIPEEFDVLLAAQGIPADPDQYGLWHSTQQTNLSRLKNPKIDKLLEDGRRKVDVFERKKIYLDFQRFLAEESPVIFLYHPISYTVSR